MCISAVQIQVFYPPWKVAQDSNAVSKCYITSIVALHLMNVSKGLAVDNAQNQSEHCVITALLRKENDIPHAIILFMTKANYFSELEEHSGDRV